MKSKTLIAIAVASTFGLSTAAFAEAGHEVITPVSVTETGPEPVVIGSGAGSASEERTFVGSISDEAGGSVGGLEVSGEESISVSSVDDSLDMDESLALADEGLSDESLALADDEGLSDESLALADDEGLSDESLALADDEGLSDESVALADDSLSMEETLALADEGIYSDYMVVSWIPITSDTWDYYVIDVDPLTGDLAATEDFVTYDIVYFPSDAFSFETFEVSSAFPSSSDEIGSS